MPVKIKICGITQREDALLAEALGADYLGFIFEPTSPRYVEPEHAQSIIAELTFAKPVGVFVNPDLTQLVAIVNKAKLQAVQLYTLPDQPLRTVLPGITHIHAIRVKEPSSLSELTLPDPDYFLVDAYDPDRHGGTGQRFDWSMLPTDVDRVFLSGGLSAENIEQAMKLQPYAIDLCSGVELEPGKKDPVRLKAFFEKILV